GSCQGPWSRASSAPASPRWCAAFSPPPRARAPRWSSTSSAASASTMRSCAPRATMSRCSATAACAATPAPTCRTRCAISSPSARQGTLPQFKRILIETSGLADPGPILQTFATDRALGGEFHVEVVVAVVDAVGGLDTLKWSAEVRKQIILADRLVIAKTDLAKPQAVKRLTARLTALNPHAAVHTAVDGDLDPRCLLESDATSPGRAASRAGFVAEAEHSDGIASFVLTDDAPLFWDAFARAMETLIALRGP